MTITATDADEEGNENSQIAFSILDQTPAGDMFYITNDGTIFVKSTLDREVRTGPTHPQFYQLFKMISCTLKRLHQHKSHLNKSHKF